MPAYIIFKPLSPSSWGYILGETAIHFNNESFIDETVTSVVAKYGPNLKKYPLYFTLLSRSVSKDAPHMLEIGCWLRSSRALRRRNSQLMLKKDSF